MLFIGGCLLWETAAEGKVVWGLPVLFVTPLVPLQDAAPEFESAAVQELIKAKGTVTEILG